MAAITPGLRAVFGVGESVVVGVGLAIATVVWGTDVNSTDATINTNESESIACCVEDEYVDSTVVFNTAVTMTEPDSTIISMI